jgi:hypothetical protein
MLMYSSQLSTPLGGLWVPESAVPGDNQSSALHGDILFLQGVENALHEVRQVPRSRRLDRFPAN